MTASRPAGELGAWLAEIDPALDGAGVTDVPCGSCTACCRAAQFIHVGADEADAIARIPSALLFPAPGGPPGEFVMGYDERGWCPMLSDSGCTIYAHRPLTCRAYDCRIFSAAGVFPDAVDQPDLAQRAAEWSFAMSDPDDQAQLKAIRAARAFLADHEDEFPIPNVTGLAVLAIRIRRLFVAGVPTIDAVAAALSDTSG